MKLIRIFATSSILLTNLLVFSTSLLAQENAHRHHLRYKLIDLGTFGGPDSFIPFEQRILNKHGTVVGIAETDLPDPFAPNCSSPNCKVQNGFEWSKGTMFRLPQLSPDGETGAQAINDRGRIVGEAQNGLVDPKSGSPEINAVLWDDHEISNLGTLGGNSSGAISVSNRGLVVGWSDTNIIDPASGETETHAFLWKEGVMSDLGTLGGPLSFGQDVNDRAQVCGFSLTNSIMSTQHPFLWENGQMKDLSLGGTDGGCGFINDRGQVTGDSTIPGDLERHAFLWSDEKLYDLGTLGGKRTVPSGLTESGHISGMSKTADGVSHAVLWRNREMTILGAVPGDSCSFAWGLNSRDQVVGISLPAPCDFSIAHAFLWEKGSMIDLNTLIPPNSSLQLVYAEAIDDRGEIVGIGVPPGVSPQNVETLGHAFVLIPEGGSTDLED